jgi:acyl carrier protein
VSSDYEVQVLKKVICQHISEKLSLGQVTLEQLEHEPDDVVWEVATKIYTQSGRKIELAKIRDTITVWTKQTKQTVLEQQARYVEEQNKLKAIVYNSTKSNLSKEDLAETAISEKEIVSVVGKFGGDKEKAKVFLKVRKIISESLAVEEDEINLDCHLGNHLGADELDLAELVMALEEEFEIEISDEACMDRLDFFPGGWSFSSSFSGGSSSGLSAGADCIVRNFVDVICEKTL